MSSSRGKYHNQRKPKRGGGHRFTPVRRLVNAKNEEEDMWGEYRDKPEESDNSEEESGESEGNETKASVSKGKKPTVKKALGSDSDNDSSDDNDNTSNKSKSGVQNLIEIENPNRARKGNIKASEISTEPREMTRREREAAEKEAARQRYWKLHAEGKTEQAKTDLARLAIVRQKREEAAKQRQAEAEAKAAEQKLKLEKEGRKTKKP